MNYRTIVYRISFAFLVGSLTPRILAQEHSGGMENPMPAIRKTVEYPIEKATDAYQSALQAFRPDRERFKDFRKFTSPAEIEQTRKRLAVLKSAEAALRLLVTQADKKIEAELVRRKIPAEIVRSVTANYRSAHTQERNFSEAMGVIDQHYYVALESLLDLATQEFGKWSTAPRPSKPDIVTLPAEFRFSSQYANEEYREQMVLVMRASLQQKAITEIEFAIPVDYGVLEELRPTNSGVKYTPESSPK